jgi:hypothetical protein
MTTTSKILNIKKDTNNDINKYFKECFYKNKNEKKLNNIYNYLKTKKIGYGHDEELKKQKKQILYIKKKINDLIERKIIESSNIEEYHELQKYIHDNINMISLYQNKTEEVEIKFNIKIDKNITYKIDLLYFLLELHYYTNIKELDSSSNEEYKQLKQLAINFKIFNDVYISDKNLESFIKSEISKDIQISDGLTKYADTSIKIKLIYIYDDKLKKHISIYKIKKYKSYYKIEISTKDDECECKLYLLNKDDTNFKQYLEKISKDKTLQIHHNLNVTD